MEFSHTLIELIRASNPHYYRGSVAKEEFLFVAQQPHSSRVS